MRMLQPSFRQLPKLQLTSMREPSGSVVLHPEEKHLPNEQSVLALPEECAAFQPFLLQSLNLQSARTSPSQPFFRQSLNRQLPANGIAARYRVSLAGAVGVGVDGAGFVGLESGAQVAAGSVPHPDATGVSGVEEIDDTGDVAGTSGAGSGGPDGSGGSFTVPAFAHASGNARARASATDRLACDMQRLFHGCDCFAIGRSVTM
jgi:hypothetical protein